MDSRAAPKAAGVSGGSPAGRAYRHGWAILAVPKSALLTGHMETFKKRHKETPRLERQKDTAARRIQRENRIAQAWQVICRRMILQRLGPMARPRSNYSPMCSC